MRLGWVANGIRAVVVQQMFEQYALVEAGAANGEVVGGPLAALILPPGLAQPFPVGLEPARCQHARARRDALVADPGSKESAILNFQALYRCLVSHLYTESFRSSVIRVHQRLASAHEKGVGAGYMQRARQGRLEMYALAAHPVTAIGRSANGKSSQVFVGQPASHFQQVLPELFFWIGVNQHVLWRVVHAAQVAGVG